MCIACVLRRGVAYVGITAPGVAHLIWEKNFRCEICNGGRLLFGTVRVNKADLFLL